MGVSLTWEMIVSGFFVMVHFEGVNFDFDFEDARRELRVGSFWGVAGPLFVSSSIGILVVGGGGAVRALFAA